MAESIVVEVVEVEGAQPPTPTQENQQIQSNEPVVENPLPAAEAQPSPQNFEWLKKYNINSEQDVESVFSRERELQTKLKELESRTPTLPYKSEFAKIADELVTKGVAPETIARFHGLKPTELDNRTAILTKLEVEFPKLTPEQRVAYYETTYGGVEDDILTEGEKAQRIINLEKEGATAREFLGQFVYQALNPNQVSPEVAQKEQARIEFWDKEGMNKLNIPNEIKFQSTVKLPGQKGAVEEKAHDFVYQIPTDAKQALLKEFGETVSNPMFGDYFTAGDTGIKNANETFEKMFWGKFGNEVAKKQMEHAALRESMIHEHYAKLLNNTDFKGLAASVDSDKSVSADKGFATWLKRSQ